MREVPLTRGLVAIVDDEDFALVAAGQKWHAHPDKYTHYARRRVQANRHVVQESMHSLILGWALVDHINGDGLDNRRGNLRPATSSQNAMNRRVRSDSRTGLKGVYRRKQRDGSWADRWAAHIQVDGRRVNLGNYRSPEEAALAYDAAAVEHFGDFARLNYPTERAA